MNRNFYAHTPETIGCIIHVFDSKPARDQFVHGRLHARAIDSRSADTFRRPKARRGQYVRFEQHRAVKNG